MVVKNIVITADEKAKRVKIDISDSNMDVNKQEKKSSKMIDIFLEFLKDDKIIGFLEELV